MDETWDLSQGIATFRWYFTPDDVDRAHARVTATQPVRAREGPGGRVVPRPAGLHVAGALRTPGPALFSASVQFAEGTVSEVVLEADPPGGEDALAVAAAHLLQRIGAPARAVVEAQGGEWLLSGAQVVLERGPRALRLTVRRPVASRP